MNNKIRSINKKIVEIYLGYDDMTYMMKSLKQQLTNYETEIVYLAEKIFEADRKTASYQILYISIVYHESRYFQILLIEIKE